mgnify:FL=1|jgi:hypothetical protein
MLKRMASSQTEPPPPLPSEKSRHRSGLFIAGFVALQFLVPLSYLVREDRSDERFTWRTLSSPDTASCEAEGTIQRFGNPEEPLPLESMLHEDWVYYVGRGRLAVVDAFLRQQCEAEDVERVELRTRCTDERSEREFSLRCGGGRAHESKRTAAR